MTQSSHRRKSIAIAIPSLVLLTIFYLIPNVFGSVFISSEVSPIFENDELLGVDLTVHNSYFLPVVLAYDGADVIIQIFDDTGSEVYKANYVSEYLHDDEEGYKHVARLSPGSNEFELPFVESSQYYRSSELPILPYGQYQIEGSVFGISGLNQT